MLSTRASRDAIIAAIIVVVSFAVLSSIDFVEAFYEYTRAHEELDLDELIALLPALSIVLGWYAYRRWTEEKESSAELSLTVEALEEARTKAEKAEKTKSDFLVAMSHEVRTPLNGVVPLSELLLDSDLDAEQRDYVTTIRDSSERLLTTINNIVDLLDLETGVHIWSKSSFPIIYAVDDVTSRNAVAAEKKGLTFNCTIDPSCPETIEGDAVKLKLVLDQLVRNAIKNTASGVVRVKVSMQDGTGHMKFDIIDSADPIPEMMIKKVFHRFAYQLETENERYDADRIGLAICRSLIGLSGGDIGVVPIPNKGNVFWFTVPVS